MNRSGIPYLDLAWNPCGFGCSRGCDGCWARAMASRFRGCPRCRAFKPHMHPERLGQPASRRKTAVIGVQFTGDLFDGANPHSWVRAVLDAAHAAPQHAYVFLTQSPRRAAVGLRLWADAHPRDGQPDSLQLPRNWLIGCTVRTQAEVDDRLPQLLTVPGRLWVSVEPIRGPLSLAPWLGQLEGVVIGADNRPNQPFRIAWVRDLAAECRAAGVKVYVKQLLRLRCPCCHLWSDTFPASGECGCGTPMREWRQSLVTVPRLFPADLRDRELPWLLQMPPRLTAGAN